MSAKKKLDIPLEELKTLTCTELIQKYNCSRQTISYHRRKNEVNLSNNSPRFVVSPEDLKTLTGYEIAKKYKCSLPTAYKIRRKAGIRGYTSKSKRFILWKDEWNQLLGKFPDRIVAEKTGSSLQNVRIKRILLGIAPARKSFALIEYRETLKNLPTENFLKRTYQDIAKEVGCSASLARQEGIARGLTCGKKGKHRRGITASILLRAAVAGMWYSREDGRSPTLEDVAQIVGVTRERVRQIVDSFEKDKKTFKLSSLFS